jgi:hypothetical protein
MKIVIEDRRGTRRGDLIWVDLDDGKGPLPLQQVLASLQRTIEYLHHSMVDTPQRHPRPEVSADCR